MSRVGFIKNGEEIREYLPKSEQLSENMEKRIIFFNLYNYYVEKEMRLSKKEMLQGENIYTVFKNKIDSLSNDSRLEQKFKSLVGFKNGELLFDLDDMFLHLVYERVKLVNKKATVHLLEKTIVIKERREGGTSTLLIPSYIKVSKDDIYTHALIKEHMETVKKTLNETKIRQVYLVYPKHDKFKRHIAIKLENKVSLAEDEYRVKMIPYSFSFCTREKRQNSSKNKLN